MAKRRRRGSNPGRLTVDEIAKLWSVFWKTLLTLAIIAVWAVLALRNQV